MLTWLCRAPAGDFRSKRKCLGTSGSFQLLAFFVLLTTSTTSGRPHDDSPPLDEGLVVSDEYGEVDNIEFHHARIVDGVLQEDHPVIMYKEDFVNEDFDPSKNRTAAATPHRARKYKDIAYRRRRVERPDNEQYHALKPEKIYFDILSAAPIVVADDVAGKLTTKAHVEVISLADDNDVNPTAAIAATAADADDSKQLLKKRPKKYHRRQRRDTSEHVVHKRNPYLRYNKMSVNSISPSRSYLPASAAPDSAFIHFAIPGEYYNGPKSVPVLERRFGAPDETDRVIWRDYTPTRNPNQRLNITREAPRPLFARPTSRPEVAASPPASFPAADASGPTTVNSSPANCVWAITGCCSQSSSAVRYSCFERYGCPHVFWDLNPCADSIRDSITNYLYEQFMN